MRTDAVHGEFIFSCIRIFSLTMRTRDGIEINTLLDLPIVGAYSTYLIELFKLLLNISCHM